MRAKLLQYTLCLILFLTVISTVYSTETPEIFVDASINFHQKIDHTVINITGKISDSDGYPIKNAEISIQVNDPYNSSVHIALVHSNQNGTYIDTFILSQLSPSGEYPVYLTVSKSGFQDKEVELNFRVIEPEFHLFVTPPSFEVEQGESAVYEISVTANFNATVHLNLLGVSDHFNYEITPNPLQDNSKAKLVILSFSHTPPGNYNFTIAGTTETATQYSSIILTVTSPPQRNVLFLLLIPLVLVFLFLSLFYLRYSRRKKREPSVKKPTKQYYVEGLPIASQVLMELPDHLRKTALILCNLGEATADTISTKTGRARAVESDYLNQLVNLGHIKKKRKGRKVYFYV